uniref:Uncharacterized protein n=1 Tax=Clytia hemisphaerica TaxID=252671 RepID=A0A7M6DL47_9CNID
MGSGGYKCSAAGGMFRGSVRSGPMTSSGTRTTQNYDRTGNYGTASKDFDSFAPQNVKPFSKPYKEGTLSGQTGNIGNHRITIRDGSKKDTPTLEIRSPRPDGSTHVRQFRYEENEEGQN